jgi:hypothetical protein
MTDEQILSALSAAGLDVRIQDWRDLAFLLAAFNAVGRTGTNALVKIDGARADNRFYTVVLSGGQLGDAFFRNDGSELEPILREALAFYVQSTAAHPPRST